MTKPTPPSAAAHADRTPLWPVLIALTAATFWTVTAEMLPSGILPSMSRDLGVPESAVGVLVSAWAVTIAIIGIPLVRLTMGVPRTLLLTISLAATAPANLLTALAPDYTIALLGRILAATAHGLFWAVVVAYVASIVDPQRLGRALSLVLAGPTLAGLAGLPVAALVAARTGWRAVAAVLSLMLILNALGLWLLLPRGLSSASGDADERPGAWDRSGGRVLHVAVGGGFVLVGHFAAFTYVTSLVTRIGGLGEDAIPVVLLVLGVTGGIGVGASGPASDRFPRAALLVTACTVALGLGLILLGTGNPALFLSGAAAWGLAIGAFPPMLQARVLRLSTPSFRPLAGSIVVTVLNLGVAAGATLGGATIGQGGNVLIPTALAAVATGILVLGFSGQQNASASPRPGESAE